MGLEHTRWWHWVVLSLILGWTLGYLNSTPTEPLSRNDNTIVQFERAVLRAPLGGGGIPSVRNLVVYPPQTTKNSKGETIQVIPVLYDELVPKPGGAANEFQYEPTWFCSAVPYVPLPMRPVISKTDPNYAALASKPPVGFKGTWKPGAKDTISTITAAVFGKDTLEGEAAIRSANPIFGRSDSIQNLIDVKMFRPGGSILVPHDPDGPPVTVRDWLTEASATYPWIHFKYAWWRDPKYSQWLWMGSTFAIVGVIWPILMNVLGRAGLGGREMAMRHYDIDRFGKGKPEKKLSAAKPKGEMSETGQQQLAAMNQSLMSELEQVAGHGSPAGPATAAPQDPARQFVASVAEPAAAVPVKPQDDKEFSGEFYPVAHPAAKPKDGD
ncbi:MAG TPA: hypothetical protein VL992_05655 [Tepidisphaeraceae bacterium]|nr:hypothetical protein [Tepidisphaeraceae bacterium]